MAGMNARVTRDGRLYTLAVNTLSIEINGELEPSYFLKLTTVAIDAYRNAYHSHLDSR